MLKYVSKFAMDILPSVAATVIGAYIVNHYVVSKPGTDNSVAAVLSSVLSGNSKKADIKRDAKPAENSADVANLPEPAVKTKGIAEKPGLEKSVLEKPAEKSAEKPVETASIPPDSRRHRIAPHDRTAGGIFAAPVQPAVAVPAQPPVPAVAPVVATPVTVPPAEVATAPEEHRDANDLARAAIERLRAAGGDGSPRQQEGARIPDAPHVAAAPPVSAPAVRPLPPPIMVSTPTGEAVDSAAGSSQIKPPYQAAERTDDPSRPTPPADIPSSRPLDLRAEAADPSPREHKTVAEDMLSAAKSMFRAVLPQ